MWQVGLLFPLVGVYGMVYLITGQGRVLINEPEYSFHNSDLKLMCLTAAYKLGRFQPSMLYLEEATAVEIADLPVQLYWSSLDADQLYRIARKTDLAQLLNRLHSSGKIFSVWNIIRGAFRKHRSELSGALRLEALSDPVLRQLFELIDPSSVMLQYSGKLATCLSSALQIIRDDLPLWLSRHLFRYVSFQSEISHDESHTFAVNFFRLAQASENSLDGLEIWRFFDESYKIRNDSHSLVSSLVTALINSIDYTSLSHEQLSECIRRYSSYSGIVFQLEQTGKSSRLSKYAQHDLNLNQLDSLGPLVFNGVGETLILLGRVRPEWAQLTEAPANDGSFMSSLEDGHLSPGWVHNVLVPSEWFQDGLVWAMTWKDDFPTTIELCNDILLNLSRFKSEAALILVVLAHLKRHPEDALKLNLDCDRHAKNLLEWRVLDAYLDYHQMNRPRLEERNGDCPEVDEVHWSHWPGEAWGEISDEQMRQLVLAHGLAPIYNQISPSSRLALSKRLTRSTFEQPGFSSNIRLGQIDEDLASQFIAWMMPLFETASFWENASGDDVDRMLKYWPIMSTRFINGKPSKMSNFVREQGRTPILTTNRRPFDYIQDVIAANPGISEHSMFVEMSDAHWKNLSINGPIGQELKDFLTCPMASRRRRKRKDHPFWIALHETIDLGRLSEAEWHLIRSMAKERSLESILAAGYLMGCPIQLPAGLVKGLPFPDWMSSGFSQQEKFTWLEQFWEGQEHLQTGLLLATKWNTNLVLPESLVDLAATRYVSAGWRKDLALLVLEHKLTHNPTYEMPIDAPANTSLLRYLIH